MNTETTVVLEQSTNTHKLTAPEGVTSKEVNGVLVMKLNGNALITHGEHATLYVKTPNVLKYNQVELDPISQSFQKVYD